MCSKTARNTATFNCKNFSRHKSFTRVYKTKLSTTKGTSSKIYIIFQVIMKKLSVKIER